VGNAGADAEEGCDYYVLNGRPFCRAHYLDQCTPQCAACAQPADVDPVAALGAVYHRSCFVCAHCKATLSGAVFVEHEGTPYCEADYYALFGGRVAEKRSLPERSHAFLLHMRRETLRLFAGAHAELWHEVRRELREEGVKNAQAHLFADGTLLLTCELDEARDAESALTAIFERNRYCAQWDALLRLHLPPSLASRPWLFDAAAKPLALAEPEPPLLEVKLPPTKRGHVFKTVGSGALRSSASAPVSTFGGVVHGQGSRGGLSGLASEPINER